MKDAINETYGDVELLVYSTVHQFIRSYGGDFDECLSVAHDAYIDAYDRYDGSSSFSSWVRWKVWYRLLDDMRNRAKHAARVICDDGTALATVATDTPPEFDLDGFLGRLSREARDVVRVVLDPPEEVVKDLALFGDSPPSFLHTVRTYLAYMGWSKAEVAEAFDEVRWLLKWEDRNR